MEEGELCGFRLERLHHDGSNAETLLAHPFRACVLGTGGSFVVCSAEGTLEAAASPQGSQVECGCWSPCGAFLLLGEVSGLLRLFHVATQREVWSDRAAEEPKGGNSQAVFQHLLCLEEDDAEIDGQGASSRTALLVLLSGGRLLSCAGLNLRRFDEDLRGGGSGAEAAGEALKRSLLFAAHDVAVDARTFCAAPAGLSWSSLDVYTCSSTELGVYELLGGVLHALDSCEVPEPGGGPLPGGCSGYIEDSPLKRRRTESGAEDVLLLFECCRPALDLDGRGGLAGREAWLGAGADGAAGALVLAYRRPGSVVLLDARALLEVYRWSTPGQVEITSAAQLPLPVPHPRAAGVGTAKTRAPDSGLAVGMALALASGDFLVCSFPAGQVLFSVQLAKCCEGSLSGLSALVAAPLPSAFGSAAAAAAAEAADDAAPQWPPLAYVVAVGSGPGAPTGQAEHQAVLSALYFAAADDDAWLDGRGTVLEERTVELTESVVALCSAEDGPEEGPAAAVDAASVPRLRRQLELFLERAAQGAVQLQPSAFLRLAKPLVGHIPGFVIASVASADFATATALREALQGAQRLLQDGSAPPGFDVAKGTARLSEDLARLATFQRLHAALSRPGAGGSAVPGRRCSAAVTEGRSPHHARRRSVASAARRSSAAGSGSEGSRSRRRHSLPSFREAQAVLDEDDLGGDLPSCLMELHGLSGVDFQAAWRRFRQAKLPELALELVDSGWPAEALDLVSRHASSFGPDDVMRLLDVLPIDLPADLEQSLPYWIASDALPLFTTRGRLVRWLVGRAELLERRQGSPEAAQELLGAVLATALPHLPRPGGGDDEGAAGAARSLRWRLLGAGDAWCFPDARVAHGMLWSGSPVVATSALHGATTTTEAERVARMLDETNKMLELFRELQSCARIRRQHGLDVKLQDIREQHVDRRIVASLLDRAPAPDLLCNEVQAHVASFCEWRGLCLDEVIEEYLLDLADSICPQDSELPLARAAALLPRVDSVERQARCLAELLKRCGGRSGIPAELRPALEEAERWPEKHRIAIKDQLALLEVQRLTRKYGLGSETGREVLLSRQHLPWYNSRIVLHLLSRIGDEGASLQDALVILGVCGQHMTRAEALFLRLTYLAVELQEHGAKVPSLIKEAQAVLGAAASDEERCSALAAFVNYCTDVLGEWAGAIDACDDEAAVTIWKSASTSLCDLLLGCFRHGTWLAARGRCSASGGDEAWSCSGPWSSDDAASLFRRLRQLQVDFDLFLDPLGLASGTCARAALDETDGVEMETDDPSWSEEIVALYRERARAWVLALPPIAPSRRTAAAMESDDLAAADGASLTRLLQLARLLGVNMAYAHSLLMAEACAQGRFGVVLAILPRVLSNPDCNGRSDSMALVCLMLDRLQDLGAGSGLASSAFGGVPPDTQLLADSLSSIEEAILLCLTSCDASELSQLLAVASDVDFAHKVLLSSDLPATQTADKVGGGGGAPSAASHSCEAAVRSLEAFKTTFQEVPLLVPAADASAAILEYLRCSSGGSSFHRPLEGTPGPYSSLLGVLRKSECMELAACLLLRHPSAFAASDLRHLCRERGVRLLRAGSAVDNRLAIAFLGCLEVGEALDLFVASLAYLRKEHQRHEHSKLQRFARLGCDLAALWFNPGLRTQMLQIEVSAKWTQILKLIGVSFEAAKLFDRGDSLKTSRAGLDRDTAVQKEARLEYAKSILPMVVQATDFKTSLALRFGEDLGFSRMESVALWAEACIVGQAELPMEQLRQELFHLPRGAVEALILGRALPLVSPYDYGRIGLVLELIAHHPETLPRKQVLRLLQSYRRTCPPSEAELPELEASKEPSVSIRRLAAVRLPWHWLAMSNAHNLWSVLAPELGSSQAVEELLPLCVPLGITQDELYIRALSHARLAVGQVGEANLGHIQNLLLSIRDFQTAWDVAIGLEERAALGHEKVALAKLRLQVLLNHSQGSLLQPSKLDVDLRELLEGARRHVATLESRWDLAKVGLEVFDEVLVQSGTSACICAMYYYFPTLLYWPEGEPLPQDVGAGAGALLRSARRLGVWGLHALVDTTCGRHGIGTKNLRQQLIEQWVRNPRWKPDQSPQLLARLEAALLQLWSAGAPGAVHGASDQDCASASVAQPGHIFRRTAAERLCLERLTAVACTKHRRCPDVPKDVREDVKTRCVFLLRIIFTKEASVPYGAKCRALAVLFRIAGPEDIAAAYRNPVEELREIWKLYFYMDTFERLGVPQDFKRLYQCNKAGLARSLWRQHQSDPQIVQVITALCLDFAIVDSGFWALLLASLRGHRLHGFLGDTLTALHERPAPGLPHDPALLPAVAELLAEPAEALARWLRGSTSDAPPAVLALLPRLALLLRRDAFADEVGVLSVAKTLLEAARSTALSSAALAQLQEVIFARPLHLPDADGAQVAARCRLRLAELALEFALCHSPGEEVDTFAAEELAARSPDLLLELLHGASAAGRGLLLRGLLARRGLLGEVRRRLPEELLGELLAAAVATRDLEEVLVTSLTEQDFGQARELLERYGRAHRLVVPSPGELLGAALGTEGGVLDGDSTLSDGAAYLLQLLRTLAVRPDTSAVLRAFAEQQRGRW